MGINIFLPLLNEATTETFIGHYKGKTAAVDASCWLHKALTKRVPRTGQATRYELAMLVIFVVIITALSAWNNVIYHANDLIKSDLS